MGFVYHTLFIFIVKICDADKQTMVKYEHKKIILPKNTSKALLPLGEPRPVLPLNTFWLMAIGFGLDAPDGSYTPSV